MSRVFIPVALAVTASLGLFAVAQEQKFEGPEQAGRGHELFFKTAKPAACGDCHAMAGKGTAAAPDLKTWSRLAPRAAAMAITATVTEKLVTVQPKTGDSFPGIKVSEDDKVAKFYDFTATPPTIKEIPKGEFTTAPNSSWKHPPGTEKPSAEELADLVAYIRWAGARDKTPVSPDDVQ